MLLKSVNYTFLYNFPKLNSNKLAIINYKKINNLVK